MKICTHCKKEKPLSEFSWKSKPKNLLAKECKVCHRIMRKRYYDGNAPKEKNRTGDRRREIAAQFREYKSTLKCTSCGFSHPAAIQFHHIDPTQKDLAVSHIVCNARSWESIMKEIDKCIPLCANCHAITHWEETNTRP